MTEPAHRTASGDDAGRTCPYCRFPVKSGAAVVGCGDCGAVHHDDCWVEGEGCAVVGCSGGPAAGTAAGGPGPAPYRTPTDADPPSGGPLSQDRTPHAGAHPSAGAWAGTGASSGGWSASGASASQDGTMSSDTPTLAHPVAGPGGPSPWGGQAPPPASSGRDRHGLLIASILVLAVAIAGSAAAILLLSGGGDDGPNVAATTTRRDTPVADRPATTTSAATPTPTPTAPTPAPTTTASGGSPPPATTADDPAPAGDGLLSPTPFRGGGFLIDPPAGRWVRDSTEKLKGDLAVDGYYETRWHLSGRPDLSVLVDRRPGATDSPESGAAKGRASNDGAPDYVEDTYRAVGGDWVWEFSSSGRHKYDRFSRSCGNGFAVLGATPDADFERWRPTIQAFAASLRPTC